MNGIPLRIAEPTGRYKRNLRRYAPSSDGVSNCPAGSLHSASVVACEVPAAEAADVGGDNWPHDDPSWPRTCACGHEFTPDDHWQRIDREVYRLPDGHEFTLSRSLGLIAPAGTMIRVAWYDEHADQPGESWLIALPDGGDWITTQRAKGGGYWTVTGTAPNLTATPSIWHNAPNGWHGWLRNGELVQA